MLGADASSSIELVTRLMRGMPGCPRLYFGVVDVRDVADLHLRAMTHPAAKGERFIAVSGGIMSMLDIATVLRTRLGDAAKRVPTRQLPNWLVRVVALFDPTVRAMLPLLDNTRHATSAKAERVLGWTAVSRGHDRRHRRESPEVRSRHRVRTRVESSGSMNPTVSPPLSAAQYSQLPPFRPTCSAEWRVFAAHVVDLHAGFRETSARAPPREMGGQPGVGRLSRDRDVRAGSLSRTGRRRLRHRIGKLEIIPQFLMHDPVIESVLTRLALEAQSGSPSGQLYAETACEFLAYHLIHTYSTQSRPLARSSGGLSGRHLRVVLDYIEESLAEPLGLRQLADLTRISPRHFERAFRQAVGMPLHAYEIEKRVAAARGLLLDDPTLTVESIAAQVGFSNASHLALAFRRRTGCSPAAFRRTHSR